MACKCQCMEACQHIVHTHQATESCIITLFNIYYIYYSLVFYRYCLWNDWVWKFPASWLAAKSYSMAESQWLFCRKISSYVCTNLLFFTVNLVHILREIGFMGDLAYHGYPPPPPPHTHHHLLPSSSTNHCHTISSLSTTLSILKAASWHVFHQNHCHEVKMIAIRVPS